MSEQEIPEALSTRWKNNNAFPQSVVLEGRRYTWKPQEEREIESRFDRAIHTVHGADENGNGGTIVGGLAPRLTKISKAPEDRAVLSDSLDSDLIARRQAEADAIIAQRDAELAQTNAILAQSKAEKASKVTDAKASKS